MMKACHYVGDGRPFQGRWEVGDQWCPLVHLAPLGVPTVIKRGPFQGPVGRIRSVRSVGA